MQHGIAQQILMAAWRDEWCKKSRDTVEQKSLFQVSCLNQITFLDEDTTTHRKVSSFVGGVSMKIGVDTSGRLWKKSTAC